VACEVNHERLVEVRVQALSEAVDDSPPEKVRPCDIQKVINSLKLIKVYGTDVLSKEYLELLPRRPLI
jgi:hypothetical protein